MPLIWFSHLPPMFIVPPPPILMSLSLCGEKNNSYLYVKPTSQEIYVGLEVTNSNTWKTESEAGGSL